MDTTHKKRPLNSLKLAGLSLAALGIVYGDIGTSPIYAFRESFRNIALTSDNILGISSLVFWALNIIISIKYLMFILRADNDGEGGPLALLTLIKSYFKPTFSYRILYVCGLLGAALLFGDGMLTPAISVLSAVEGLTVATPHLAPYVVPITVIILIWLFSSQHHGSAKIGTFFGVIMLFWFSVIGILGVISISQSPEILNAIHPWYAINFFYQNGYVGYLVLGGVFLVVTGGEALYSDIGHFGIRPIRMVWFSFVLPALLLNYFGQGALLLRQADAITHPFFLLAADWFLYPLIILTTLATIIASQAIISGVFSIAKQAILLQLLPRLKIVQTSSTEKGQVYIPLINMILAIGTIGLVLGFQSSTNLAGAYGIAVNLDMFFMSIFLFWIFHHRWKWPVIISGLLFALFVGIDLAFLGANLHKFQDGGWFPIMVGVLVTFIMLTWREGIFFLRKFNRQLKLSWHQLMESIQRNKIPRVPGCAVFISEPYDEKGVSLLHQLHLNQLLPETIVVLSIEIAEKPIIPLSKRFELVEEEEDVYYIKLHYGFMQNIHIPNTLKTCQKLGLFPFMKDIDNLSYYLEVVRILVKEKPPLFAGWRRKMFSVMYHNVSHGITFYHLPYNRTIAIGTYYEI